MCTHENYPMEKRILHKYYISDKNKHPGIWKIRFDLIFLSSCVIKWYQVRCFHGLLLNSVLQQNSALLFSTFSSTVQSFLLMFYLFFQLSKSSFEERIHFLFLKKRLIFSEHLPSQPHIFAAIIKIIFMNSEPRGLLLPPFSWCSHEALR